jgi:DUF971 family protein
MTADTPEHIAISKSKGVKIDWADGHRSEYSLAWLRDNCPCASCTGAEGGTPQRTNYARTQPDNNPLKLYQPAIRMLNCEEVGHYAVRFQWSDGHATGIYSYRHLREICPCAACRANAPVLTR